MGRTLPGPILNFELSSKYSVLFCFYKKKTKEGAGSVLTPSLFLDDRMLLKITATFPMSHPRCDFIQHMCFGSRALTSNICAASGRILGLYERMLNMAAF